MTDLRGSSEVVDLSGFPGILTAFLSALRVAGRLPGLRKRFPRIPSGSDVTAATERGIGEWKAWAVEYLAWYEREYGDASLAVQRP